MPTPPKSDWGMDAKRIGVHRCGRKTMLPTSFIQTEGCLPLPTLKRAVKCQSCPAGSAGSMRRSGRRVQQLYDEDGCKTDDREPDAGVGRDADGSGMIAMRALAFFVDAATKFIATCCTAQ